MAKGRRQNKSAGQCHGRCCDIDDIVGSVQVRTKREQRRATHYFYLLCCSILMMAMTIATFCDSRLTVVVACYDTVFDGGS
jgi:uncharacterized membrane protein